MQMVFYLIWLLLLTVLQSTVAREIDLWGIAPNFILCFVVLAGYSRGKIQGAIVGGIFGLVYDILIGRMIGVNSLCYFYIGFASGVFSERFFSGGKRLASVLTTIVATIFSALVYYFARLAVHGDIGFFTAVFRIGFPEAIYNGVMSFCLSFPMMGLMKLMHLKRIS